MSSKQLAFVTGVSSGFGRAISISLLNAGYRVVGTVRRQSQIAEFEALAPEHARGVVLDVTVDADVAAVVTRTETDVGPIEILINNAGYGHEGIFEESSLADLRAQFDVNVFGAAAMIKAVLPFMRERGSGRIVNITSMGGLTTFPGLGIYHASKFALEGLSESLGKEVKSLGILVTAVEPGGFRTDWAGRSMVRTPRSIPDYDAVMVPIRDRRQKLSGNQPGDPTKAGDAIVKLIASENPPAHLLLGADAFKFVSEKIETLQSEFEAWKAVTLSTDFPAE
jgi:NAD(P)-dependent dehydrogenase (short-subunit alcohol dehydrogenase family)